MRGPLTGDECRALAGALGERPEYAIPRHHLRRGSCTAYCLGAPTAPFAALVQPDNAFDEPTGLGQDAAALHALLLVAQGWDCVEVELGVTDDLADRLSRDTGWPCRLYRSVYYRLEQPLAAQPDPAVRLLTLADEPLLRRAPPPLQGTGWSDLAALLREGTMASAVVAGEIVASAFTVACTSAYAEIGVETLPAHRGRGYASAAAALVAAAMQGRGLTPTWSTGEDNWASQRVAAKIGMTPYLERMYLIPQREEA